MKKWIALILALAMTLAMAGCGCAHAATETTMQEVNAETHTAKLHTTCTECGKVVEKQDTPTGIAPQNGTMFLSPAAWFECLSTNINTYGKSASLVPMDVESEDGAILRSLVSPYGFQSVISFFDKEDKVITTEQGITGGTAHRIRVEAQFDNNSTTTFYTLIMLMAMTNNADWNNDGVNALAQKVMGGETVIDNGYSYTLEIISPITHTVALHITAE